MKELAVRKSTVKAECPYCHEKGVHTVYLSYPFHQAICRFCRKTSFLPKSNVPKLVGYDFLQNV